MATGTGVTQGKTAFVEDFLSSNPDAAFAVVNQAWKSAGNIGSVSESLVSKSRSRLKPTGERGSGGGAGEANAKTVAKGKAKSSSKVAKGKGASKAEEAPTQPEAREGGSGPGKSAFVEGVLRREPKANVAAINRAWAGAGHEGAISPSVFYKVKRERGVTGKGTPAAPAMAEPMSAKGEKARPANQPVAEARPESNGENATPSPLSRSRTGERERVLDRVEDGIDDLIIELKQLGGMEDALEALRKVRRVVVRSHEG